MAGLPSKKEDRLFVRDGRRNYRRTYSRTEFRIGLVVLLGLAGIAAWVAWRGAHPDPALFEVSEHLLQPAAAPVERGPVPAGLAPGGWRETNLSVFDAGNLYEKINGREDYYKAFGFEKLYFVSLLDETDPARIVDLELFDLALAPNALGAYAGERPPDVRPRVGANGMTHTSANALFLTRGRYYARAIGADTTSATRALLAHLEGVLDAGLPGEPLPWAYALFVGEMGFDPGRVSYMAENAFSFGFASNVYAALLDDESQMYVVACASDADAASLALQFERGFSELADGETTSGGVRWIRDRYLGAYSGARADGRWVAGVRGAADAARAAAALGRLRQGLATLPAPVLERARESAAPAASAAPVSEY